jgi:hypothetical protein
LVGGFVGGRGFNRGGETVRWTDDGRGGETSRWIDVGRIAESLLPLRGRGGPNSITPPGKTRFIDGAAS